MMRMSRPLISIKTGGSGGERPKPMWWSLPARPRASLPSRSMNAADSRQGLAVGFAWHLAAQHELTM